MSINLLSIYSIGWVKHQIFIYINSIKIILSCKSSTNLQLMMMMMILTTLLVILVTLLLKVIYDTLSCYYLTPLRIKKIMEKQGVCGPKPSFLTGNLVEISSLVSSSTSQDMESINHDIVGRLLPHFVAWSNQFGMNI